MAEIDYYKTLQDQNYKELLDREIQLDSARQRALRNTNTNLAAAGMDSSGLGALAQGGIENQYLQGLNKAQNTYQEQALQNQKDQYGAMNNAYDGLYSDLSNASFENSAELDKYLTNYGLMKDGAIDRAAFDTKYGADNFDRFNATIGYMRDYLDNQATASGSNVFYTASDAASGLGNVVDDEVYWLYDKGSSYVPAKDGTVVMLKENNSDKAKSAYLMYKDGHWVSIDAQTYHTASEDNKYEVYSDKNSNKYFNVKHNGETNRYKGKQNVVNYKDLPSEVKEYMRNNGVKENPAGGIWSWKNQTIEYNGKIYKLPTYGNEIQVYDKD